MAETNVELEIDRQEQGRTRLVERPLPDLAPNEIRLRVERFALTANNVTYAAIGDMLGYWDFFPTEPGWGRVPAMGWGEIVESAHPEVPAGSRHYGWFPMSRWVQMTVGPTADGVRDEGAHRAGHAPVYRNYVATDRDALYEPGGDAEDRHALLRGLFLTAFLADDFFEERGYHGAAQVVVLSASSKTAIGYAQRAARREGLAVVGLTSARNADFVRGLGWYDRVLPYEEVTAIPAGEDAVVIDMAGNGEVLERVHAHLGDRLRHSMTVGLSHHDAPRVATPSCGPTPELFFAPTQVTKRMTDWGPAEFQRRTAAALREFVAGSRDWLEVRRMCGPEALRRAWTEVRDGRVTPNVGVMASAWDA